MDLRTPTPSVKFSPAKITTEAQIEAELEDELNCFVRYSRLGLFQYAEDCYNDGLKNFEHHFEVLVERADNFLERGQYGDLSALVSNQLDQAHGYAEDQVYLLKLLRALADIHVSGDLWGALYVSRQWKLLYSSWQWRLNATNDVAVEKLSVVDNLSLYYYLRIVAIASKSSSWVSEGDRRPLWSSDWAMDWFGSCEPFKRILSGGSGSWLKRCLFRSLLIAASRADADRLYSGWRLHMDNVERNSSLETNEDDLLADLSVTTSYARCLLASIERDEGARDRVDGLIQRSRGLLGRLIELVSEVDDLRQVKLRPALELGLLELQKSVIMSSNTQFYSIFQRDPAGSPELQAARANIDRINEADLLRLQYLGKKGVQMNPRSDGGLPKMLHQDMQDRLGYLAAMTDRILSFLEMYQTKEKSPLPSTERPLTELRQQYRVIKDIPKQHEQSHSGMEMFLFCLSESSMTTPTVMFKGLVAQLLFSHTLYPDDILDLSKIQKIVPDLPGESLHWLVKLRWQHGANFLMGSFKRHIRLRDSYGWTPLNIAVENRDIDMVRLLLNHGANPRMRGFNDKSLLDIAIDDRDIDTVKLLLRHGGYPRAMHPRDQTPLYRLVQAKDDQMVQALLDHALPLDFTWEDWNALRLESRIAGGIIEKRISQIQEQHMY